MLGVPVSERRAEARISVFPYRFEQVQHSHSDVVSAEPEERILEVEGMEDAAVEPNVPVPQIAVDDSEIVRVNAGVGVSDRSVHSEEEGIGSLLEDAVRLAPREPVIEPTGGEAGRPRPAPTVSVKRREERPHLRYITLGQVTSEASPGHPRHERRVPTLAV